MIRSINEILGYKVGALDDEMGTVEDFFIDDREWIVRYLVVDTGKWLPGRRVLISPVALGDPVWADRILHVSLSKDQIKESPEIGTDLPVSRQKEAELVKYYGWTPYWEPLGAPASAMPLYVYQDKEKEREGEEAKNNWDPNLRSLKEVCGYNILSSDKERVGHVEELITDTDKWSIRYMIVDTGKWLFGRKVLVAPQWLKKVDETAREVWIDLPGEQIKNGPEFNPSQPVNREYEVQLYDYYGRPTYWDSEKE
jgi:sporulation protein YlmC with PRC-barrel domain